MEVQTKSLKKISANKIEIETKTKTKDICMGCKYKALNYSNHMAGCLGPLGR